MAKFEDGSYQCLPGPALIAKALAGRCKMKYTRASVGQGTIPEGVSPKSLTEPPDYVMEAKIAAVTNPVDGECQVTVQINSSDVETGFYAMGIMLYAEDPDLGEVPYTYLKLEDGLEWIRPSSSAVGKLATFDLISAVGAVDAVLANIDPDALVTRESVQQIISEHSMDLETHPDIRQAVKALQDELGGGVVKAKELDITIPADRWKPDKDTDGAFPLRCDIDIDNVTDRMLPMLTVWPECMETAGACRMSSAVRTVQGGIRVYAKTVPTEELQGTLTLFGFGASDLGEITGKGGGAYALPVATATRLGGVRVKEGSGLVVDDSGNLAIDAATAQEIADVFNGPAVETISE